MPVTTIDELSLTQLLSPALANDPSAWAMAAALDSELQEVTRAIPSALFVELWRQDDLTLDYIATEMRVWGYQTTFDRDLKISLILNSLYWNAHKGTKGLMDQALSAIFGNVRIMPWWTYGGTAYHFRAICSTPPTGQQIAAMNLAVFQLKSVRDYFEGFFQSYSNTAAAYIGIGEMSIICGYIGTIPRGFPGFKG
jgi:P2-related tail formation protein